MKLGLSHKIQLWKTVTWSIISVTITTIIAWLITGSVAFGVTIGIADRLIKMLVYFVHERFWHKKYKTAKRLKERF